MESRFVFLSLWKDALRPSSGGWGTFNDAKWGFLRDAAHFNGFGYFSDIGGGFAKDFPDDVVPGEVLFADVFV